MRGIVLAGGTGSRLWPVTFATSKQLIPIFDKPMIYYPVSTLIRLGVREILIVSDAITLPSIQRLFRDGSQWGVSFRYRIQDQPNGIAEAFRFVPEEWGDGSPFALILGDNLFGQIPMPESFQASLENTDQASCFLSHVKDPERYGVARLDTKSGKVLELVEKPKEFISPWASVGLYKFPADVLERWKDVEPSARGEFEITDLLNSYIPEGRLDSLILPHGTAWLDSGTFDSLSDAGEYVRVLQKRQGCSIGCIEIEAVKKGLIGIEDARVIGQRLSKSSYGESLLAELLHIEKALDAALAAKRTFRVAGGI